MFHFVEKAIDDLLSFFRETFPDQSITPKLHLLEDHVIPFLRRWSIGFGLYGEQGMEALHSTINDVLDSFISIADKNSQLESLLGEH